MQTLQIQTRTLEALPPSLETLRPLEPSLVLVFASTAFFESPEFLQHLQTSLPGAALAGCSTAGEIAGQGVYQDSCVVTALRFEQAHVHLASTRISESSASRAAGRHLGEQLPAKGLRGVMLIGPGVNVNGSALIDGLTEVIGQGLPITGGLAGDNGAFVRTWTLGPQGISHDAVVAIGLYGESLQLGHGSCGGWQPFGPARKVTRSEGNILYELDGEPALTIYKRYLGDYARDLPSAGLLFPFAMLGADRHELGLIRTILGIDETHSSLILAGDIEQDGYLRLMHASTDALVDGAESSAKLACPESASGPSDSLALLVSCVGRRLVMGDRVDEEVEAVAAVLGQQTRLCGFYSYGEISPFATEQVCKLHNQTMTITTLSEI